MEPHLLLLPSHLTTQNEINHVQSRNKQYLLKMANLEELFELSLSVPLEENEEAVSSPQAHFTY